MYSYLFIIFINELIERIVLLKELLEGTLTYQSAGTQAAYIKADSKCRVWLSHDLGDSKYKKIINDPIMAAKLESSLGSWNKAVVDAGKTKPPKNPNKVDTWRPIGWDKFVSSFLAPNVADSESTIINPYKSGVTHKFMVGNVLTNVMDIGLKKQNYGM